MRPASPLRLGISSCLLGQKVRYDGNHQRDSYITLILGKYFGFVPVCPEVAIGLGGLWQLAKEPWTQDALRFMALVGWQLRKR
jgi:hypothetical protein